MEDKDKILENSTDDSLSEEIKKENAESVEAKSEEVDSIEDKTEESNTSSEDVKSLEAKSEKADSTEDKTEESNTSSEDVESLEAKSEKADSTEDKTEESDDSKNSFYFPYLIGKKIGMSQLFSEDGKCTPTTVLEVGPCLITQIKNTEKDGYNSVQLGYGEINKKKINKAKAGYFNKNNIAYKKYLKEFRVKKINTDYKLGDEVTINQFEVGDQVNITGCSKGKGFTGHMKRHGFSGGRRSHGKNSVMRKAGSIGAGSDPSRVFPGMKMAGRKGNFRVTIKNLSVMNIDKNNNLLYLKGAVPGAANSLIYLSRA